jgi:hypothetical protein
MAKHTVRLCTSNLLDPEDLPLIHSPPMTSPGPSVEEPLLQPLLTVELCLQQGALRGQVLEAQQIAAPQQVEAS